MFVAQIIKLSMYIVSRKVLYGDCGDAWPNVMTLNLFDISIAVLSLLKSIKSLNA